MQKYTEDDNGYITITNNPISKSGIFQYLGSSISPLLNPNEIYNVWRPEIELNNPETIESFKLTPWIPEHIMLGAGFTPAEVVGVQGVTGETVTFSRGTLYSKLKLFGEDLKKLIKAGLKELSCGFRCKWIIQNGVTPEGEPYDVIQTQIRGNHLASVDSGRMGSDVRVAMDRAIFALDSIDYNKKPNGENMELKDLVKLVTTQGERLNTVTSALDGIAKDMKDAKEESDKAKKTAKDEDGEKDKEKAKDEEKDKKDKEEKTAMDKAISDLTLVVQEIKSNAMDGNALLKAYTEKQNLAGQVSKIVGAFDHADMDINGVAKYGLEKMNVPCDSGLELPMLKGILHARQAPTFTVHNGTAADAEDAKSTNLDKVGL